MFCHPEAILSWHFEICLWQTQSSTSPGSERLRSTFCQTFRKPQSKQLLTYPTLDISNECISNERHISNKGDVVRQDILSLPKTTHVFTCVTHVLHLCKIGVRRNFHIWGYLFTHGFTYVWWTCVNHVQNHMQNIAHVIHLCNQVIGHITHVLHMC